MTKEEVYELSFNTKLVTPEERVTELVKHGIFYNPFEDSGERMKNQPMINVGTHEITNGVKPDGEYVLHNGFTAKVWRKILVKDNVVIRAWEGVGEDWVELVKQEDNGWWVLNEDKQQ